MQQNNLEVQSAETRQSHQYSQMTVVSTLIFNPKHSRKTEHAAIFKSVYHFSTPVDIHGNPNLCQGYIVENGA